MKEFETAARELEDEEHGDPGLEFALSHPDPDNPGEKVKVMCRAYKPKDGQFAILMAATGRHSSGSEQVAGLINFFMSTLDDDSQQYIAGRLLDRKDPFDIDDVQDIMEWAIEEWSGRPTQQSRGSTPSRQSTGRKSTGKTPALT